MNAQSIKKHEKSEKNFKEKYFKRLRCAKDYHGANSEMIKKSMPKKQVFAEKRDKQRIQRMKQMKEAKLYK